MENGPDTAMLRWAKSLPAARCAAAAIRPWTRGPDSGALRITTTPLLSDHLGIDSPAGMTTVARGTQGYLFLAARVARARAVVLHAGSEADEASFTAVLDDAAATRPPRILAVVAGAPRTADDIGLGSTRAAVERVLGPGHATARCGYEIVRYEPVHPEMSAAEMWFFYRADRVAAFVSYAAV